MPRGRPVIALGLALGVIGALAGGLAWLLDIPKPPPGASRAARLYYGFCAECHGTDGRGSWRAMLLLIRPRHPADPTPVSQHSHGYLARILQDRGAPLGRPGLPGLALPPTHS